MCGIIGFVSASAVAQRLVEGLKRLEYRGYDSAGILTIDQGAFHKRRSVGKIAALRNLVEKDPIQGTIGIGHTRWATHGSVTTDNAHPHANDRVGVVHNGIIENHTKLRDELIQKGYAFSSETDSEVIVHLADDLLRQGSSPIDMVQSLMTQLQGAFAFALVIKETPNCIYIARRGAPLAIGEGENEMMLGSDAVALAGEALRICYLEEGDIGVIYQNTYTLYDASGMKVVRPIHHSMLEMSSISKGHHRHFMHKEIHEQPLRVADTLQSLMKDNHNSFDFSKLHIDFKKVEHIQIIACGTSYYAGLLGKYWFEMIGGIRCDVDLASEFRYREPVLYKNTLVVPISQSGETTDTLAALQWAISKSALSLSIVNVAQSSIARLSHDVIYAQAGPEIGVATTKAFTCQLSVLLSLAIYLRQLKGEDISEFCWQSLRALPTLMMETLLMEKEVKKIADDIKHYNNVLFIGRGTNFPIALEGALKLKEVSYIHAEAYAGGELKHGPIALIDDAMPVIAVVPHDRWFEKTLSNIQEIVARKGKMILLSDQRGAVILKKHFDDVPILAVPNGSEWIKPVLLSIPLQFLSYQTAVMRGTDVDQPRNLAKSVTVE